MAATPSGHWRILAASTISILFFIEQNRTALSKILDLPGVCCYFLGIAELKYAELPISLTAKLQNTTVMCKKHREMKEENHHA